MSARIAVCVSGEGTNLRALRRYEQRGLLGGSIGLVLADRPCPALAFAVDEGIPTALVSPGVHSDRAAWDEAVAEALGSAVAPDSAHALGSGHDLGSAQPAWVVLAGFMRLLGPATLRAFGGRIINVHPSLLPAFPGSRPVADALAAGARVTGVTVHLVDESLDAGPIIAQEAVPILPSDDPATLLARLHAVEHRLLPHCVALALAGALRVEGTIVRIDEAAAANLARPRRALVSVSDKNGLAEFARALDQLGFELVSTGGTARALRGHGLRVTDVAEVTGFPEMLDGRVKTLHPRIEAGVLADLRRPEHRAQLAAAQIDPFELVVVNLYPFAAAAAREGATLDELVEEIDIGGPTLVRAAAKNHDSVAVLTDPAQYDAVLAELGSAGRVSHELRQELAGAAFRLTAGYDEHIAAELATRWWGTVRGGAATGKPKTAGEGEPRPDAPDALPESLAVNLQRIEVLRYGENPHQRAALYRPAGLDLAAGPFSHGPLLVQGKALSHNNILDAAAAAGLARDLRGAACVIVKHANPCGAAEADTLAAAWQLALAGDPVSAFGGVVAVTRPIDPQLANELAAIFLEVILAPACEPSALDVLARRPNVRLLLDPGLEADATPGLEMRSAGGAVLVTDADVAADDPRSWQVATRRAPTDGELAALDAAWRICRHVKSNAIVLVRDSSLVGVGAGQMSRVDSARLAVAKAGAERAAGAVCASDAFYPFPDALEACAEAGVTAFVQPGGSQRDAEVIAAADAHGAAMVLTGVRHFRH